MSDVAEQARARIQAAHDQGVDSEYRWTCTRCGMPVRQQWITFRKFALVDRVGRSACFQKRGRHKA